MSTSATDRPLRPEDLPPSPPPRKRRGMGTVRSMVLSMIVLVILLFAFVAIVPRPDRQDRLPVDSIVAVQGARQSSGVRFSALEPVPAGWTANNATYSADTAGVPTWSVGYVHDGVYAGLRQTAKADKGWYTATLKGFERDGSMSIDGVTWERWANADSGERRLVRRGEGGALTSVLVSSTSYDDAAAFGRRLTPRP